MPDERRDEPPAEADRREDDDTENADTGGDPACWLSHVCPECGRFVEADPPTRCDRCGTDIVPT